MRLIAIHKSSAKIIEILGVSGITEKDGIYYISGVFDAKSIMSEPLTVMHGGTVLFRARNIELDGRVYTSVELSN
jgi:hypothetical protein